MSLRPRQIAQHTIRILNGGAERQQGRRQLGWGAVLAAAWFLGQPLAGSWFLEERTSGFLALDSF